MKNITISEKELNAFEAYLFGRERSAATVEKYLRDLRAFGAWLNGRTVTKAAVRAYKEEMETRYRVSSLNSMLSSLNTFFRAMNWRFLRAETVRRQRCVFSAQEKELTKEEYGRLLIAARDCGKDRLFLLMQTICSTGMRVSEVRYLTTESLVNGYTEINCKGKRRQVYLSEALCVMLRAYCKREEIEKGQVFRSRYGKPLNRSDIWAAMKRLCAAAGVPASKVYPHNLRHLFARTHYEKYKDIVRLADILGHENVNTTRIYTMESGETHRRQLQELNLLMW